MNNTERYDVAFTESLMISDDQLPGLQYQGIPTWDSVGHMTLMARIEDSFEIMLEMDDILDFSSYDRGKEILAKYAVII